MRKIIALIFALSCMVHLHAQMPSEKITARQLPKCIKFKGKLVEGHRWADSAGAHFILLCETGVYWTKSTQGDSGEDSTRSAALFAYHYLQSNDSVKLQWMLTDFEKECPVDVFAEFSKASLSITDLNKNGIPEIWFIYKTTCAGDVSPRVMKLMMYEGKQKCAIRGTTKVQIGKQSAYGGELQWDASFQSAYPAVKAFAKKLWDRFSYDRY